MSDSNVQIEEVYKRVPFFQTYWNTLYQRDNFKFMI